MWGLWFTGARVVNFVFQDLLLGGPQSYQTGITDLDIRWQDGAVLLYAASGIGGGVSTYRLLANGSVQLLDQDPYAGSMAPAAPGRLEEIEMGGAAVLVALGWQGNALQYFDLGSGGQISGLGQVTVQGGLPAPMLEMARLTVDGTDMIYASHFGQQGLTAYSVGAQLIKVAEVGAGAGLQGANLVAIEAVQVAGQSYLMTASVYDNSVTSYRLDGAGVPVEVDSLGAANGLGINAPTALIPVEVAGEQYLVLAASQSSSLSLLRVTPDGGLEPVDHILDDLQTRFDGVTALASVTIGDRVFVVAGGSDDGLSLFTVLPGGRFLHLDTIADSSETALTNIAALEIYDRGGIIEIFASGEGEAGITHLSIDPGTLLATQMGGAGDDVMTGSPYVNLMVGGDGDDNLDGWNGDDILMDGAGSDTLRGGLGADTFVLAADGEIDTIIDFELGLDRLDLSTIGRIYSLTQIDITTTTDGATLRVGNEVIELISKDYMPLQSTDFQISDLVDLVHYPQVVQMPPAPEPDPEPEPQREVPVHLIGGAGQDMLRGGSGDDTLEGGLGADTLDGGFGTDTVSYTGEGRIGARLDGGVNWGAATGDVIRNVENLIGGGLDDVLIGSQGSNLLQGGAGNDAITALGGDDTLEGGAGADTLDGGFGTDTVSYTGEGRVGARLDGGVNWGAATGDVIRNVENLIGGAFDDTLIGNSGANVLQGGGGADVITALGGDDTLAGGAGADVFVFAGGFGNDTIMDFEATNNAEKIDLSGVWAITDWADLSDPVTGHMTQQGADVVIDDLAGNTITLTGTDLGQLHAVDFIF